MLRDPTSSTTNALSHSSRNPTIIQFSQVRFYVPPVGSWRKPRGQSGRQLAAGAANDTGDSALVETNLHEEEVTLYRARFAGFSGKDEARAACAQLTKKDFACLALRN
jgi:hypothetical protein